LAHFEVFVSQSASAKVCLIPEHIQVMLGRQGRIEQEAISACSGFVSTVWCRNQQVKASILGKGEGINDKNHQ
jgi:hypothetical protein